MDFSPPPRRSEFDSQEEFERAKKEWQTEFDVAQKYRLDTSDDQQQK